ncbi:hypothetical protein [Acinetobacter sp. ANC 5045]|uniref:hypothetical protein n=1 Tax=Acinetobacter sp. ANC 5045 TaxID=2529851 RepID=UPI00103ED1A8|nr:hypothetical protein [Acinetobacter sp. ANC 5045]TCB17337.1 hypothetical protein E0H79_08815 [Acinetobacter sp. ANC 5045]
MNDFEKYWEESASKESWANKAVAWNIWKEKQAIIDNLKAQLNNMEACYIEKKKQVESCVALVGEWRETHIGGWSDYARGSLHSRQDCADDLEKALRGDSD